MALKKEKKKEILKQLEEALEKQEVFLFVNFAKLKVKEMSLLREKLKEVGSNLKVAKKTLIRKALEKEKLTPPEKFLDGEVAVVFGFEDEILPAKTVWNFSKEYENLKILGGFFEGNFIGKESVINLGQLPTKDVLLSNLLRAMSSPLSQFLSVLEGNIKGLVTVLSKIK